VARTESATAALRERIAVVGILIAVAALLILVMR
jgi:hypothetical protein